MVAGPLLRVGRVGLQGRAPNGQHFIANVNADGATDSGPVTASCVLPWLIGGQDGLGTQAGGRPYSKKAHFHGLLQRLFGRGERI